MKPTNDQLRETVRRKYAEIAASRSTGCCGSRGDDADGCRPEYSMIGDPYDPSEGYVAEADLGLGCGLPVEHAGLEAGQTVLDLGSGAGVDVFVARREVGESGRVIGVDMTAEMVARARENAATLGYDNVEFRLGEIENLPLEPGSVDAVVSNCVLNLVPDKKRAFAEVYRVLKPGGHFCISDIVASRTLPEWATQIAEAYAGCVSGAIPREDYLGIVRDTGFEDVEVLVERRIDLPEQLVSEWLTPEQLSEAAAADIHVLSITVRARK